MKDLVREYVDSICELKPGFFLGESEVVGAYATPDIWSALVKPKSILLEKAKTMGDAWNEEFEKNPGFPKVYTCTVSKTIHSYDSGKKEKTNE